MTEETGGADDLHLDDFAFDLPPDRIALAPHEPRDQARLLSITPTQLTDHHIGDLPGLLRPGDVLVVNDARVLPARLRTSIKGQKLELLPSFPSFRCKGRHHWYALASPVRRARPGRVIEFPATEHTEPIRADIIAHHGDGRIELATDAPDEAFLAMIQASGELPLPPYITKRRPLCDADRTNYQTIFATRSGAVAAPTAGLHFTPELLARLAGAAIGIVPITLYVGPGTFLPVRTRIADHVMLSEWGEISHDTAERLNGVRQQGGRIIAIGTTTCRLLESSSAEDGRILPWCGWVDIFIRPGHRFRAIDLLVTNFHLPRSTLFLLVSAFAGCQRMRSAYGYAIANRYRFYSYGDACLIEPSHRA